MTAVVRVSSVVGEEVHHIRFRQVLRILLDEFCAADRISSAWSSTERYVRRTLGLIPERNDRFSVFEDGHDETVLLLSVRHEQEGIVVDVAKELDSRSVITSRQLHNSTSQRPSEIERRTRTRSANSTHKYPTTDVSKRTHSDTYTSSDSSNSLHK